MCPWISYHHHSHLAYKSTLFNRAAYRCTYYIEICPTLKFVILWQNQSHVAASHCDFKFELQNVMLCRRMSCDIKRQCVSAGRVWFHYFFLQINAIYYATLPLKTPTCEKNKTWGCIYHGLVFQFDMYYVCSADLTRYQVFSCIFLRVM